MDPRLHQHRGAASVLGLLLVVIAIFVLISIAPVQGQSAGPAALPTPTPTATPLIPPDPPTGLTPADGDVTTGTNFPPLGMPTFGWTLPPGGTLSHIQISDSQGFSVLWVDEDTEATSYTPTAVWPNGSYYWRVKVATGTSSKRVWGEYTAVQTFNKDWSDGGQIRPTLIEPENGQGRSSFKPTDFTWTPVPGAAGYLFEIASDANFATVPYKAETLKARHTPTVRLGTRLYYWRVTPFSYTSNVATRTYGSPSDVWTFSIDWTAPPQQLAPANAIVTPFLPRFQWQAVEGAKNYQLQVGTDSSFNPTTTYNTSNTDFTPPTNLSNDKEYFWRVKASDQNGNETEWSTVRSFRTQWHFAPQLLTPRNNQIQVPYPFFSWKPVPGAEKYQIQIDDTNQFAGLLIADVTLFNVTTYAQLSWSSVPLGSDAYWRVRAIDADNNYTPWSETWALRTAYEVVPNLIYPSYTFEPDTQNLPVHRVPTIAWPVFVWDTAHSWISTSQLTQTIGADYYELTVDEEPAFDGQHNLFIRTRTLGAAPVLDPDHPEWAFSGLQDGKLYYWRVQAFHTDGTKFGLQDVNQIWEMKYSGSTSELFTSSVISPTQPQDGYQAVATPPVLGWLPVVVNGQPAANYHVQISPNPSFTVLADEAYPQFVNYVPWQGTKSDVFWATYWWRVRAESTPGVELTGWSEPRSFSLSHDLIMGNYVDWPIPARPSTIISTTNRFDPSLSLVATSTQASGDAYQLNELHVMLDRSISTNLNWVFAFDVNPVPGQTVRYGVYIDNNHITTAKPCEALSAGEMDPGAPGDDLSYGVVAYPLYAPEYIIDVIFDGTNVTADYYRWNGVKWNTRCKWADRLSVAAIGGDVWYDPQMKAIQLLVPYTALAGADDDFSGSLGVTLLSTAYSASDGIHSAIPPQMVMPDSPSNTLDNPVFVSDMLQPLYPFDTPLTNPMVYYDMPPLRWRTPVFDSIDGYKVQLARDERFTQIVETWETYESSVWSFFALLPATFQSTKAMADNESYYWRVCIRHEKVNQYGAYDYGPWSPAQRFKLDSRIVGNPRLSTGSDVFMTPTFEWDRVEGAASYRLQLDDDPLFGSPLLDVTVRGTSYTPQETSTMSALSSHITYYWRVAIRRSDTVLGAWTPAMALDKNSVTPVPLSPLTSSPPVLFTEVPTFVWSAVLTPSSSPRLAAPLYQLQVDNNADFKSPEIDVATPATSYTPIKGKSLADGTWYWRVAMYEATGQPGPWSVPQTFDKQYPLLKPVEPLSGSSADKTPRFGWLTAPGAAYYILEVSQDSGFQSPSRYTTSNTSYTPKDSRKNGIYYWRVKMVDHDGKEGPILPYRFNLGQSAYLPYLSR